MIGPFVTIKGNARWVKVIRSCADPREWKEGSNTCKGYPPCEQHRRDHVATSQDGHVIYREHFHAVNGRRGGDIAMICD